MTSFRWAGSSDTGRVRSANQDRWHAAGDLFVVADGMGGHRGGEVASAIAIETLRDLVGAEATASTAALLDGVQAANAAIFAKAAEDSALSGMGTTLCALAVVDHEGAGAGADPSWLAVANVGDSRVYLWAGGELRQITQDHSLVEDLVRQGRLSEDEAAEHPQRNILTRALGVGPEIDVDFWELPARAGDRFVLCSDGLFNEVQPDQIAAVLRRLDEPAEVADELVRMAIVGGGRDNVTVVVADVVAGPDGRVDRSIGEPRVRSHEPDMAGFAAELPATADRGAPGVSPGHGEAGAGADREARSRTPLRALGWLLGLAAVAAVALLAVGLYARSSFYVDVADGQVVIYQGRPGGVLWFDPSLREITEVEVGQLTALLLAEVEGNPDYASIAGARDYVEGLIDRLPVIDEEPPTVDAPGDPTPTSEPTNG